MEPEKGISSWTIGQYENFILMGDINVEPNDASMKNFCQIYGCKNIVKDKTCFKSPINPTCIDLMITNRPKSFQESEVIETGLSDFPKMSLTVMNVFYNNRKSFNKKYKDFSNEAFFFLKFHLGHSTALLIIYFKNMLL